MKKFILILLALVCVLGLFGCNADKDNTPNDDNSFETIGNIDELLKPYQEVLDRLNAEYDYKLYIPEDRKYSVYDAYKDLTPEEFEQQILEELNGSTEDFVGNGEMNFEIVYPSS